jgi:hypothetical protein
MSPTYVHTVKKKDGRVYRYLRGPGAKRGDGRPLLHDDIAAAQRRQPIRARQLGWPPLWRRCDR